VVDTTEPGEVCVLCDDLDVSERQLLASHGNVGLFGVKVQVFMVRSRGVLVF
jgi:hypothetical protein